MLKVHLESIFVSICCSFPPNPHVSCRSLMATHITNAVELGLCPGQAGGLLLVQLAPVCCSSQQGDPVHVAACPELLQRVGFPNAPWLLWM